MTILNASYAAEGGQGCKSGVTGFVDVYCTYKQLHLQNRQILLSSGNARHALSPVSSLRAELS